MIPPTSIGAIAESETAELPEVGNLGIFPCLFRHTPDGIAEEQPDAGDGVNDDIEQDVVDDVPRQANNAIAQAHHPVRASSFAQVVSHTHHHPNSQTAQKIVSNHFYQFLSFVYIDIISCFGGFVNPQFAFFSSRNQSRR